MKVIFASGYSADAIAQRGILDAGAAFLPKPLTPRRSRAKVREVLDAVHAAARELTRTARLRSWITTTIALPDVRLRSVSR